MTRPPMRPPLEVAFFTALFLGALAALLYLLSPFVGDFVLAWMFTSLLGPLHRRALARLPGRPRLVAGLLTALVAVLVAVPVAFLVVSLSVEVSSFYAHSLRGLTLEQASHLLFGDGFFATRARAVATALGSEWTPEVVRGLAGRGAGSVAGFVSAQLNHLLANLVAAVAHFILMLFIVFVMLEDGARILRFAFDTSPLPDEEEALLVKTFGDVARATLFGNGVGSLLQGVLGALAMAVVGLPSPVLWGTVMTVLAFLPIVGISFVWVPATVVLLAQGRWAAAVGFAAFNFVQGLVVENVVKTQLIGAQVQMHPLLAFLSIVGGIALFGVLGLVYGPLIVALFTALAALYHRHYKPLALQA